MDLKINNNSINQNNFLNFLADKILGNICVENDCVNMSIWSTFDTNIKPSYLISFNSSNSIADYVDVYVYKIENGEIKGYLSDLSNIIKSKIKFEIIDIGYMNSTVFFKGSIINEGKLDRNIIIMKFNFDMVDFLMEIEKN